MSTCVVRANPDDIIMIPTPFITFFLLPYLTLKKQILPMFQSFAYKHTVLNKKFTYLSKIMHNFFSCIRVNVQYIARNSWQFIFSIKISKPLDNTIFTSFECLGICWLPQSLQNLIQNFTWQCLNDFAVLKSQQHVNPVWIWMKISKLWDPTMSTSCECLSICWFPESLQILIENTQSLKNFSLNF